VARFRRRGRLTRPASAAPPEQLPAFTLGDADGEPRAIGDFLGRPMVLNFWATWCPPCLREMPLLADLHARSGTSCRCSAWRWTGSEPVGTSSTILGIEYPVLVGEQDAMDVAALFGDAFLGLPFTVFADADGRVVDVHLGEIHDDMLRAAEAVLLRLARGRVRR
jgi:thiol-disulfide isomerase/thioredoxin